MKTGATTLGFGLAALQTTTSRAKILGANDTARLAFVGVANRGRQLLASFAKSPDATIAALCDVDSKTLDAAAKTYEIAPENCVYDFRKLYERDDLDGIVVAAPDHWHAYMTIEACKAGLDVYCEKPLATSIVEGRMMVQAARKYDRVVMV